MTNPVAWLIEWDAHDGQEPRYRARVQFSPDIDPWMARWNPKVTPLVRDAELDALRAEVEAHKRGRQIDANEARSREMELRAEVERLKADIRDARGLMRGMIDAKDGRVARFLIERAERFIQRTADPTGESL